MREILSQRLKTCREEHKLKQWEIAVYSNITERAYQNYELGTREPKLSILMRIAEFYKVSLDYLVGLTDDPAPYPRRKKDS